MSSFIRNVTSKHVICLPKDYNKSLSVLKLNSVLGKCINTSPHPLLNSEEVKVTFVKANGERITAKGKIGDTLLDVVVNNSIDFDGYGACEGTLTCSTCHVILKKEDFERLPDKPSDEEFDMLDLAFGLTDTSRLGCQIQLTKDLDGLEVKIPATVNDARS